MPAVNPYRRRRSMLSLLAVSFAALLVITGGLVTTLWLVGVPLPFLNQATTADPYLVRIPVNVRPISAYNRVDRADLLDPSTGWVKFQELPPQAVLGMSVDGVDLKGQPANGKIVDVRRSSGQLIFVLASGAEVPLGQTDQLGGALLNVGGIIGRVVKKDKTPGLGFREDNFFPRGTPEGIAGATPPGMRSIILDAGNLKGIHALPAGARIDLMANIPLEDLSSFDRGHNSRLPGAALVLSSAGGRRSKTGKSEPVMLAQEALVLKPVYQRVEATTTSTLADGKQVRAVPVYEAVLAVHPGDVIPLQTALNKQLQIICVAHSMQRSEKAEVAATPTSTDPAAPVTSRSILAYEVLTYDYFQDAATRRIRHEPVTNDEIKRLAIITSVDELVGKVVKHDIPKGSFITEADLLASPDSTLPKSKSVPRKEAGRNSNVGRVQFVAQNQSQPERSEPEDPRASSPVGQKARPNIVGEVPSISRFVPPGHKAVAIPWNRLYGAEHLQIGDVVDLTVSYSLQYEAETKETERRPDGTVINRTVKRRAHEPSERTYDETLGFRGEPWFAALNAKVIGPVGFPPPSAATRFLGGSLYQKSTTGDAVKFSGPPLVFAVEEKDEEAVSAALASKDAVLAVVVHPSGTTESSVPQGWKRIVLAPEGISAFVGLSISHLEQSQTRRLLSRFVREDDPVYSDALTATEIRPYIGRVLRHHKDRRSFFTAVDFFPAGVSPGFAAELDDESTVYVAEDRDIEGLENFQDNDRIAILFRAVLKRPEGVIVQGADLERPIATTIVPSARILRASQEDRTVLAIRKQDLARLQAAWAVSFSKRDGDSEVDDDRHRRHLVAVLLPNETKSNPAERNIANVSRVGLVQESRDVIPDYDPIGRTRVMETIIGSHREVYVFSSEPKDQKGQKSRDSFRSALK